MKKLSFLSVLGLLVVYFGIILVSCNEKEEFDPLARVNYFISEYYTIADASARANSDATMWGVELYPQKRVTLKSFPELYKSLAMEHGEDGRKKFRTASTYAVPYNVIRISVMSDGNDVSENFDISFETVRTVIKEEEPRPTSFKTQLSLVSKDDLMWLIDCRFFITERKKTEYSNLVAVIESVGGKSIVCKLPK